MSTDLVGMFPFLTLPWIIAYNAARLEVKMFLLGDLMEVVHQREPQARETKLRWRHSLINLGKTYIYTVGEEHHIDVYEQGQTVYPKSS